MVTASAKIHASADFDAGIDASTADDKESWTFPDQHRGYESSCNGRAAGFFLESELECAGLTFRDSVRGCRKATMLLYCFTLLLKRNWAL